MTLVLNDCGVGDTLELVLDVSQNSFKAWDTSVTSGALLDALANVSNALNSVKVVAKISNTSTDDVGSRIGTAVAQAFAETHPTKYKAFITALLNKWSAYQAETGDTSNEEDIRHKLVHNVAYEVLRNSGPEIEAVCGCKTSEPGDLRLCKCSPGNFHPDCSQISCPPPQKCCNTTEIQQSAKTSVCQCAPNTCQCSPDACECQPSTDHLSASSHLASAAQADDSCGCSPDSLPRYRESFLRLLDDIAARSRAISDATQTSARSQPRSNILPYVTWNAAVVEDFQPTWGRSDWETFLRTKLEH